MNDPASSPPVSAGPRRAASAARLTTLASCRLGVLRATPLAFSSGLFGLLYGVACASLGISAYLAALSCVLVFSGAVQFAVLAMLDDPLPIGAIAVSSLLICNRLVLMGISISDHLRSRRMTSRILSMFVLTDGAWAATIAEERPVDGFAFFVAAGLWILALWVAGTVGGTFIAGVFSQDVLHALGFSGVLFLALLLLLVVRSTSMSHAPWIVAAATAFASSQAVPLYASFLAGTGAGACVAWVIGRKEVGRGD